MNRAQRRNSTQKHPNKKRFSYRPLALAIAVAISGTLPSVANAATYTVSSIADSGAGSLRDAISQSEANSGLDNIVFSIASGSIINLGSPLSITDDLTITGPTDGDAGSIILDGGGNNQIINSLFPNPPGSKTLTLENMTIQNGSYNGSATTLTGGGGIYVRRANLIINNSLITNNTSNGSHDDGGGIYLIGGDLTLNNTTVSDNQTNGISADGGGISVNYGDAKVNNSTISGNSTLNKGGGLRVRFGDTEISQSTISGNASTSSYGGGGLFTNGGKTTIQNSTITNNTANTSGAGISVNLTYAVNSVVLSKTILSGNTITGGAGGTVDNFNDRASSPSATLSATYSLFGDSPMEITGTSTNNQFSNTPNLGPLLENGGPTKTHLPITGSSAIGNGGGATALLSDQRGLGFPRTSAYDTDIGAVEVQTGQFFATSADDSGPKSLRRKITDANAAAGDNVILVASIPGGVINLNSPLTITDTVKIIGNQVDGKFPRIDAGQNSRHITADFPTNSGKSITLENLTLQNGKTTDEGGGSISVANADLILTNTIVRNNSASGGDAPGGGISVQSGNLTLNQSTVSNNSTYSVGGGLTVFNGDITLNQSTVSGNSTSGDDSKGGGFALYEGDVTLNQSTVSGNSTTGNEADGGGFYLFNGNMDLNRSTITNNKTNTDSSAGIYFNGYAYGVSNSFNIDINNTILSNNIANQMPANLKITTAEASIYLGYGSYINGSISLSFSAYYSLLGTDVIQEVDNQTNSNFFINHIENNKPGVGPLQNNGGPTLTHLPNAGSPAIDKGAGFVAPDAKDQRGEGFPRIVNNTVDIGATESVILPNKGKAITRAEIVKPILQAALIEPSTATIAPYGDVALNSFNVDWIDTFKSMNFTEGCDTNKFCPNEVVTKEQLAKMIIKAKGIDISGNTYQGTFTDVPNTHQNALEIEALSAEGFTLGCEGAGPSAKFCPQEIVTHEIFNNILNKAFK